MKRFVSALFFSLIAALSYAQTQSGELSGKITDEKGEPLFGANVAVKKNGVLITGTATDFDGFYSIKPLAPGNYDVEITSLGYAKTVKQGVVVSSDKITTITMKLKDDALQLGIVDVTDYRIPLIDKDDVSTKQTISAEQIKALPTRNVQSIASTTAGVYQGDEGGGLNIKGGREDATEYYIDGIRVRGSSNIPANSIEQLTVITGGVPARYGDATGGIVNITTRGPSKNYSGSVEGITSQFMDPVGYNLLNFSLTGPLYTKNKGKDGEKSVIGFFLAGEYLRQQDDRPAAKGLYVVKEDVLRDLEEFPLIPSPNSDAFLLKAETLTLDDLERVRTKKNVASNNASASAKLDFQLSDNVSVTLGGSMNYNRYHDFTQRYSLMNYKNNPLYEDLSYRVFGRFTQKLGGKKGAEEGSDGAPKKASVIQNAFYSVQFDYSKDQSKYKDDDLGNNVFAYGHTGTFDVLSTRLFDYPDAPDSTSGKRGWTLTGFSDTLVNYTPSTANPEMANYTRHYYELAGDDRSYYRSLDAIRLGGGYVNGERPPLAHSLWFTTGRQFNGFGVNRDNDQFRMFVSGSFDIVGKGKSADARNKHAIELGIEFEQRVDRGYSINPIGMWTAMRQLANRHILELDKSNPILWIDGVGYDYNDPNAPAFGQNDTILYNRKYNGADQSYFDKQLRQKLGFAVDGGDFINIDGLSPETFDLKMFSPDELLNQGNPFVNYFGYNAYGEKSSSNASFNDFFTKKDANGNYTREIGAFRPVYTAAFIQDKFMFKDVLFNIGLRIDRFDANQKVLKDPYLLYQTYTAGEVRAQGDFAVPASIGDNYYVYVDNFEAPTKTIGYRTGDIWYNEEGVEIIDPSVVARNSTTGRIAPYLVNKGLDDIKSENFDPNTSFKDYDPQIVVMPRLSFSFNLTDNASFFAHYDVLAQRPQSRLRTSPLDWYFFENNIGGFINNPDLKPERTIDYQLGFRQKVSNNSAITISAFYRDLKDQVQVRSYNFAYPNSYFSFGNRDFGNVKGFLIDYDMRKTASSNFSMKANYTLQFADGTGSDNASQANLIQAGQPNLRTVAPLSYDSRHIFTVTGDYSYGSGKKYNGPVSKNDKQILANSGINVIMRARSGSPYTKQSNATPDAATGVTNRPVLAGSLNGQRMPFNFRFDVRVFKDFQLTGNKKKEGVDGEEVKKKAPLYLNVYVLVQNILNTANVLRVYPYTGNADDDGYITSTLGQQDVNNKRANSELFARSYEDLYFIYGASGFNPNGFENFSLPRQLRIGASFTF
jgi:outer membrane receptor protein involved in Fe transport